MNSPLQPPWPKQPTLDGFRWHPSDGILPSLLDLPHRVMTHSGRSAIGLALREIGVKPGEGVLLPTYHCPTMIAPIELLGAVPIFYGLDGNGMPILPIGTSDDHVRAALVPHLFGMPRPMSQIAEFCRTQRIALIEDCAHCFFGKSNEAPAGSVGDYAVGSLPKFFPTLEGGILASSRHPIHACLPHRSVVGSNARALWDSLDISARSRGLGLGGAALRALAQLRHGARPGATPTGTGRELMSSVLVRQHALSDRLLAPEPIRAMDRWIVMHTDPELNVRQRQKNFALFAESFADVPGARLLITECPGDAAPYVFPLLLDQPDTAYGDMRAAGLPVFRWDRIWPDTPAIHGDVGLQWANHLIQFACHQSLGLTDIEQIASIARRCVTSRI